VGRKLRKLTAILAMTATLVAGFPAAPVFAQQASLAPASATSGAPVDQTALISSTIGAFPNGGEPLKLAIADLILKNPEMAPAVAAYLKSDPELTPEQKQAIYAGLAEALNKLGIVAQVGTGIDPMLLALLVAGGLGAGFGIYELTKNKSSCTVSCN
jgi:hypothetical protein